MRDDDSGGGMWHCCFCGVYSALAGDREFGTVHLVRPEESLSRHR